MQGPYPPDHGTVPATSASLPTPGLEGSLQELRFLCGQAATFCQLRGLFFPSHGGWGDEMDPDTHKTLHSVHLPQIPSDSTKKVLKLVSL